jgi:hypothetical protein
MLAVSAATVANSSVIVTVVMMPSRIAYGMATITACANIL